MNYVKSLIVLIAHIAVVYIVIALFVDSKKLKNSKEYNTKSSKYIVLITVIFILFIAYGILRNF